MNRDSQYQPGRAWLMAVLLFVFILLNFADKVVLGLLAVPIIEELKFTPTQFGLISSSFFWLFSISGVLGGMLADRIRTKWFLVVMALSWSLIQLPIIYGSTLAAFIVARALLGVGEGPAWPVAVHAVYKWFPNEKRNMPGALFSQAGSLGLLLAGLTVPLVNASFGWRAAFIGLAGLGLVWAVAWTLVGREGTIESQAPRHSGTAPSPPILRIVRTPTVLGIVVMHFVAYWSLAGALTWLPAYFQKGLGFDNVTSGQLYGLVVAATIPMAMLSSWWSQRLLSKGWTARNARGRFSSLWLVLAGLALLMLMMPGLSNGARIAALALALGCVTPTHALVPAMMAQVAPGPRRGTLLALDNALASVAGILAPTVAGALIERHPGSVGFEYGFLLTGVLLIVGGCVGWFSVNPERAIERFRHDTLASRVRASAPTA